jgi:predicted RNA-binding Zn-ribbon protein involved in translation (DUF1610 family)
MASAAPASHLVEVADPPVPNRTSPVREMSATEKLKITIPLLALGPAFCMASWWLFHNGFIFFGISSGGVGLLCIAAAFSKKNLKAACPYCGTALESIPQKDRGEGRHVHCDKCHEYSTVNAGILRPLDPATTSETPTFESPVFHNSLWPKGCVACGEAPVRFDDLSKTTVGALPALVGRIQILKGSISGIPYCSKHRDQLSMKIGVDKKMILCWTSLRMMRRYLAANRNRPVY